MEGQLGATHAEQFEPNARTRESLLRRVRNWGDDESWQEFFNIYWKIIYTLAVRSGLTECEAEEIVQATMISVANNIRTFEYDPRAGKFRTWVCNQARWKIADHLRRRSRENALVPRRSKPNPALTGTDTVARVPDERDSLAAFVDKDWDEAIAEVALARVRSQVNPKQFQIFDLFVVKNWPVRRVSQTMKVSAAYVYLTKSRIVRLLKRQKSEMEKELQRSEAAVHKTTKTQKT